MLTPPLPMTAEQRSALEVTAQSTSLPHRAVLQAKALLWAGEGVANEEIGRRCGVDPKRARWRLHFTPTSSPWTNLVERWFKEITERRLRRDAFSSVDALVKAIETWTEHWNDDPKPFVWHKPAEQISEKVRRERATLHQINSATDH